MENKIKIINSFFSENALDLIDKTLENILNSKSAKSSMPIFSSSISHWEDFLIRSSTPILRYFLNDEDKELTDILKKEIESQIPYYVNGIVIHICPKLSYIPWHNDRGHTAALTVYLNKDWDANWGGYFMYKDSDEVKAIKPERNVAVLQKGGIFHSVSTTNMDADYRISIQCFLQKEKKLM